MNKIEKIRKEIERMNKHYEKKSFLPGSIARAELCLELLGFIESLEKESDFPTTDEEVEKTLSKTQPVEVPDKYKNPDWLFKKIDLEKEIETYAIGLMGELHCYKDWFPRVARFAKHFYELGLAKEE